MIPTSSLKPQIKKSYNTSTVQEPLELMIETIDSVASQPNSKEKISCVIGMEMGTPEKEEVHINIIPSSNKIWNIKHRGRTAKTKKTSLRDGEERTIRWGRISLTQSERITSKLRRMYCLKISMVLYFLVESIFPKRALYDKIGNYRRNDNCTIDTRASSSDSLSPSILRLGHVEIVSQKNFLQAIPVSSRSYFKKKKNFLE